MDDTIYALASAPGRAGVAVLRLSGPRAGAALEALTGRPPPPPRRAALRRFRDIDQGLVLWFPAPASVTGEDVAELHAHGGRAVLQALSAALRGLGLRLAGPGEFTRRSFENGKLDLTAAEGLADLVDAGTEAQRVQALRQLGGALAELYEGWRAELLVALAHLEADIDFPDEDLPGGVAKAVRPRLVELGAAIGRHLDDGRRGERLRDGLSLAILGAPNVGKSSLLNALARRDAAIVSAFPGTTRDPIEVHLDLGGYPLTVIDTAGLRESDDPVEREGVRRARARAAAADLRLLLLDAETWPARPDIAADLVAVNKIDQRPVAAPGALPISVATGAGMESLLAALTAAVHRRLEAGGPAPALTRARHREALEDCAAALDRFLAGAADPELAAEDVRLAARALGRITGRVDVEDVLDLVFRDFCIGK